MTTSKRTQTASTESEGGVCAMNKHTITLHNGEVIPMSARLTRFHEAALTTMGAAHALQIAQSAMPSIPDSLVDEVWAYARSARARFAWLSGSFVARHIARSRRTSLAA